MTEPFLGQVTMTAFDFAPRGYAHCDGAALPIAQNQALYALLGTAYGGDGQRTFNLPDLRGRVPIHRDKDLKQGEAGGQARVTLTQSAMPTHSHALRAQSTQGTDLRPPGKVLAADADSVYRKPDSLVGMHEGAVTEAGGSQPHDNMQPYTVISYCIAVQGLFPSRD